MDFWNDGLGSFTAAYEAVKNYVIQSHEVTEDLDELLSLIQEPLLDEILHTWFVEYEGMDRKEKEALAKKRILESFNRNRIYLTREEIHALEECMLKHPLHSQDLWIVCDRLLERGWVFAFMNEKGPVIIVLPKPLQAMFTDLLNGSDDSYNMLFIRYIRTMLKSCLNLFGVIEKDRVADFVIQSLSLASQSDLSKKLMPENRMKELSDAINEILDNLLESENLGWQDKAYVIHNDLENRIQYRNILRQCRDRVYFLPSGKQMDIYGAHLADPSDPWYKSVEKCIRGLSEDYVDAASLMRYITMCVVEDNADLGRVAEILRNSGISCPSKKTDTLMKSCGEWLYTVKRWCYRGMSAKELGKAKIGVSHAYLSGRPGSGAPVV